MRLREFAGDDSEFALISVLQVLKNRAEDTNTPPVIKTKSLVNLVRNTNPAFSYDALVSAYDDSDAVKELISDLNADTVQIKKSGFQATEPSANLDSAPMDPMSVTDTVSRMANKALAKRT
jgi:hypothetical protein